MQHNNIKIKDPLGLGLSILLNTVISAFGAPVGPIIVALLIGVVIGCWIIKGPGMPRSSPPRAD